MNLNTFYLPKLILALVMLVSIQACWDYSVRLPGGYSLVRVYSGAVLISNADGLVVVDSNVERYKVLDGLIVGYVTTPEYLSPEEKEVSIAGYFILNTETNEVKQGLDKRNWLNLLQSLGITGEPHLNKPSRFDKNW